MLKLTIQVPGGELEITGDTQKALIEQAAFWQSLPLVCPVDGTPTRLHYKEPKGFSYYGVVSTGARKYEMGIGQHKEGGTLYAKDRWSYFDGEREVVVWEYGRPTNEAPAQAQPEAEDGDEDDAGHRPALITQEQIASLNKLGIRLYGNQKKWVAKLPDLCSWASRKRTSSLDQLWQEDADALLEKLTEKAISSEIAATAAASAK